MSFGLYIHIPFCRSRCPYCDFAFVVRKTHLSARYARAVVREFHARIAEPVTFDTLYFGGGTPSAVPVETLRHILDAVSDRADVSPDAEITAEANPGDQAQFGALRSLGINRLSLGVQALADRTLKALGRFHTAAEAIDAFRAARSAGFDNIGIDLIFGAPGQSLQEWHTILESAIALGPEHISVYGLTIEPGTNFGKRFDKGRLFVPLETEQADMYECAIDSLERAGFEHYEISNFARPGFASRHNLCYWQERPYFGLGLSAHSHLNGYRSWNVRDLMVYMERVETKGTAIESEEFIDADRQFLEHLMLGLRQRQGLEAMLFERDVRIQASLQRLFDHALLERADNRIRLTRRGLLLADAVCVELAKEI